MKPRVSVLMSVYNGDQYLEDAIESILNQTFTDFEFIIVDDGSLDSSPSLLARYQQRDPRVLIHRLDRNRVLSAVLNFGINLARGEYIARMDADDISLPNRLQEQVAFMDAHPEVGVCGTWVELIGEFAGQVWKSPKQHDAICARLIFCNNIAHPSVMLRLSVMQLYGLKYDESIAYGQDYDLWSRALPFVKFAIIDAILLQYRLHASSITSTRRAQQIQTDKLIYARFLDGLAVQHTSEELDLHQSIGLGQFEGSAQFLHRARNWLEKLLKANAAINLIPSVAFEREIDAHWTQVCLMSNACLVTIWFIELFSPLSFHGGRSFIKKFRRLAGVTWGRIKHWIKNYE